MLANQALTQPWFGRADTRSGARATALTDAAQAMTGTVAGTRVVDGLWRAADRLTGTGGATGGLQRVSLAGTRQDFAANMYYEWLVGDTVKPPGVRTSIGQKPPTPQQIGEETREVAIRQSATAAAVTHPTGSIAIGPRATSELMRHVRGEPLGVEDAAHLGRVVTHELGHVAMPGSDHNGIEEALAELVARNPAVMRQTLRDLALPTGRAVVERATAPMSTVMAKPGEPVKPLETPYDRRYGQLREVFALAGIDPDSRQAVRLVSGRPVDDTMRDLQARMLERHGIRSTPSAVMRLGTAVFNWFGHDGNESPAAVLARLGTTGKTEQDPL